MSGWGDPRGRSQGCRTRGSAEEALPRCQVLRSVRPPPSKGAPCAATDPGPARAVGGCAAPRPQPPLRSLRPVLAGVEMRGTAGPGALPTPGAALQPGAAGLDGGAAAEAVAEGAPANWPSPREWRKQLQTLPCPGAAAPARWHGGVPGRGPCSCMSPSPSPAAWPAALPSAYWKRKLLGRQRVQRGSFGEERLARLSMLPGPGPVTGSVCSQ